MPVKAGLVLELGQRSQSRLMLRWYKLTESVINGDAALICRSLFRNIWLYTVKRLHFSTLTIHSSLLTSKYLNKRVNKRGRCRRCFCKHRHLEAMVSWHERPCPEWDINEMLICLEYRSFDIVIWRKNCKKQALESAFARSHLCSLLESFGFLSKKL